MFRNHNKWTIKRKCNKEENKPGMKRILRIVALSIAILVALSTVGCAHTTRIGDILSNTSQYDGKDLTISGTVGKTAWFTLLEKGAYQIGDGTNNIWVVTSQPPPQEGQSISTKGKVQSAFSLAGQSYGTVLEEIQRN